MKRNPELITFFKLLASAAKAGRKQISDPASSREATKMEEKFLRLAAAVPVKKPSCSKKTAHSK